MQVDAVVVAAGGSTRFGRQDKLLADLCGRPVLAWSLLALGASPSVGRVVVVAREGAPGFADAITGAGLGERVSVVAGGERRRDSVEAGIRAVNARYVAVHDAARPLVSAELVERVIAGAEGKSGAIAAIPVTDTIKEVRDAMITGHPDRSRLWAAQTPQVVLRQAWLDAAAAGDGDETDDAAMLARLGLECAVVEGDPENLKITRQADLEVAARLLALRGATT